MYSYNRIFIGIPLSQTSLKESYLLDLLEGFCRDRKNHEDVIAFFEEYEPESENEAQLLLSFKTWYLEHLKDIQDLDLTFQSSYHGAEDYPLIFGKYIDNLFPMPDYGAEIVNFENVNKIIELKNKVVDLFKTLPEEIVEEMPIFKSTDVWFNNHSS